MVRLVSVDVETAVSYDHVVEIGLVEIVDGARTGREFKSRFKPRVPVSWQCEKVHGLSARMLAKEPSFESRLDEIIEFVGDAGLVAHNKAYEYNTLRKEFDRAGRAQWESDRYVCTMKLAKAAGIPASLRDACRALGIPTDHLGKRHDALEDARLGADLYIALKHPEPDTMVDVTPGPVPTPLPPVACHAGVVMLDPVQVALLHRARIAGIRVSGLTGAGKSTLAAAIAADAARRGKRCLLFGTSPRLASPPPLPGREVRLHPTLQARFLSGPGPASAPPAGPVGLDTVAARAALDPDGAALAVRLLAKATGLVSLHGLTPSDVERSVMPADIAGDASSRLALAIDDARMLADEVFGGNERPGATMQALAGMLAGGTDPEGVAALVLDASGDALDAHLAGLAARADNAERSRQELLRLAAALGEHVGFAGTVSQACAQARTRFKAVVGALNLLGAYPTAAEAAAASPHGSGEARVIAWCIENKYERKSAIQACSRLSVRDEGVVEAVEPFLAAHGGRSCADVRAAMEADKLPPAPEVDLGALAQRLRGARHAAVRLRETLPLLADGLPEPLMAAIMAAPLDEVAAPEANAAPPERLVAADMVRALREEFTALGYGDILAPPERFEERVAKARALPARTAPGARPVPAEILDLLLPSSPAPADAASVSEAWSRLVTALRPEDRNAGPDGLLDLANLGFDVVVIDDAGSLSEDVLTGLRMCAPIAHEIGAGPAPSVPALDRPHRQVATGFPGTDGALPRLGGPVAGGLIRCSFGGTGRFDPRYAANFLAARGRDAGLDTIVVSEGDAGGDHGEHDVIVVWGDHPVDAAVQVARHARLAVVACAKAIPPGAVSAPRHGPETEGLAGLGWALVASANDGRVYRRDGKLGVVAVEPYWLDLQEEDVHSRIGRLRALGWNPVMGWSGSERSPAALAAVLDATAVPAGPDLSSVFGVDLPGRPALRPFAVDTIPFPPGSPGKLDVLRWRLRYLRDVHLAEAAPYVEPGRCILRDEMIEAIIAHGVRDQAGFQELPQNLRESTDGIHVPLLETIGAVMDDQKAKVSPVVAGRSSGLTVPRTQLNLPDIVPPHMIPPKPPAPRAGA